MKARVKTTGEIIDIAYTYKTVGKNPTSKCETLEGKRYNEEDLDFNIEDDNTPDYWTRLEHQAVITAMRGILGNQTYTKSLLETSTSAKDARNIIVDASYHLAHVLVQKLKEKEERK